jgi:hypothetical protein
VIRRCLEKDPDERFQNARDLAFALEHHSGISSSGAAPVGPRSTRRLWLRVAAAVLAASGLAGAAFVLGARQPTRVPEFEQLTFRRGSIFAARFTPDGNSVVYSAFFDGNPIETYSMRLDQQEPLRLDLPPAGLMGLSPSGEMALRLGQPGERRGWWLGTLARAPLSGGSTRQIVDDVAFADWAPNGQDLAVIRKVGREGQLEYPVGNVLRRPIRGGAGLGMRVSPRGDKVAFTAWDGTSSVTVFDRSGGALVLKTEPLPGGLAWDPSGDAVWTLAGTGMQGTGLWRLGLDGSTRLVTRLAGHGSMLHDVARDGRFLISLGVAQGGLRAKPPDETAEREVCPFGGCLEFDLSNDGRQILLRDTSKSAGAVGYADWIFLQPTNGGPPVRLGRGFPEALSPDGRWALASGEHGLELMPTGAGTPRSVNVEGLKDVGNPQDVGNPWFPDADHVLIMGEGEDGSLRTHLLDLAGGKPKPVTPDNVCVPPGPVLRGSVLGIHREDKSMAWYPLAGGDPRPLTVRLPLESRAVRVSADGQGLLFEEHAMPGQVDRLDLTTGRRTTWKTLLMEDRAGVEGSAWSPRITPDGRAYAYGYLRFWVNLYLVDGVR